MAARNLAKVWKAEMGLSQGGKAYHRGSIPAKFEILQYRENCYHIQGVPAEFSGL